MNSLLEIINSQFDEQDESQNEMPSLFSHSSYYSNDEAVQMLKLKTKFLLSIESKLPIIKRKIPSTSDLFAIFPRISMSFLSNCPPRNLAIF